MSIFVDMRTYAISATPGLHNPSLRYVMCLFRCQYVLDTNLENPFQFFKDVVPYEPCLIVVNDALRPNALRPNATNVIDPRSFAANLMAFVDLYRPSSCTVVCAQSRGKQFAESVREVLAEAARVHHHLPPFSSLAVEGLTDGAVSWTSPQPSNFSYVMPMNLDLLAWMLTKLVGQDNTWHQRYKDMYAQSAYSQVALPMALDAIRQYQMGVAKVAIDVPYYRYDW